MVLLLWWAVLVKEVASFVVTKRQYQHHRHVDVDAGTRYVGLCEHDGSICTLHVSYCGVVPRVGGFVPGCVHREQISA